MNHASSFNLLGPYDVLCVNEKIPGRDLRRTSVGGRRNSAPMGLLGGRRVPILRAVSCHKRYLCCFRGLVVSPSLYAADPRVSPVCSL